MTSRLPTESELLAGRSNFAVIRSQVETIDRLLPRRDGNLRAAFHYHADGSLTEQWLEP